MPLGLSAAKDGERKKSEGLLWQLKHVRYWFGRGKLGKTRLSIPKTQHDGAKRIAKLIVALLKCHFGNSVELDIT